LAENADEYVMMIMANIEEANEIISDNSDEYDRNGQNAT
jgi:hypothetical protein